MLPDLKFAWRRLLKSPSFAVTAIITLALGIGANAVVFSVLNALVLHTLNVPNAQSFYSIEERGQSLNSYPDYQDLRDRTDVVRLLKAGYHRVAIDAQRPPARKSPRNRKSA